MKGHLRKQNEGGLSYYTVLCEPFFDPTEMPETLELQEFSHFLTSLLVL